MVGKGSVRHNERKFNALNTDPTRSCLNTSFINEDIKDVYHELFDKALQDYNAKQNRTDRRIDDYYKKIVSGKQEKPFHEVILQIGNRDDMNAETDEGRLAEKILTEYIKTFQERNPNLRVFSAHLHMDEATPHLHIDFVPFTTGSKRGLDTRVSLKQALAKQGFNGGTRGDTEWNQWVLSEKEELSKIMERYGVEWEQKGTHEKHLSVLDYEKKMRSQEVEALTEEIAEKQCELKAVREQIETYDDGRGIENLIEQLNSNEFSLPEPAPLMTAKAYKAKYAEPLISKLKSLMKTVFAKYLKAVEARITARGYNSSLQRRVSILARENSELREQNRSLIRQVKDYSLLQRFFGKEKIDELVNQAKGRTKSKKFERNR